MASKFCGEAISEAYARFRPSISNALVKRLLDFYQEKHLISACRLVLDVGCGTGSGTRFLATKLSQASVEGIDSSPTQLKQAAKDTEGAIGKRIKYRLQNIDSEGLPYTDNSVDIIVAIQAAHWFNLPKFFQESTRILKPGGVLAIINYTAIRPRFDSLSNGDNQKLAALPIELNDYLLDNKYWDSERKRMMEKFQGVEFPFPENLVTYRDDPTIFYSVDTTVGDIFSHLSTWSGLRTYYEKNPQGTLMEDFKKKFLALCPPNTDITTGVTAIYPWYLIMTRKPMD